MKTFTKVEQRKIDAALDVIRGYCVREREPVTSPGVGKNLMTLHLAGEDREVFAVMFLNSQHELLALENLFYGTIDGAAVYPREVAKRSLEIGAAAVIFGHNHPSGTPDPSTADRRITERLVSGLGLLDIRVLDHFVVAGDRVVSFAEEGML